jgi:predicted PurR-regulated permease PerM
MNLDLQNKQRGSVFLFFAAVVITLAGIKLAATLLVPFLLSLFVAIICGPPIQFLAKYKVPRSVAITLIILFIFLAFTMLGSVVASSANGFRLALPNYQAQLTSELHWFTTYLGKYNISISLNDIQDHFDPAKVMSLVSSTLSGFSSVLGNVFLLLLTVIFMLGEGVIFSKKLHFAFGKTQDTEASIAHFLKVVNQYMAIKTMISLITGLIIGTVLWIMGVDFFVLWGLLAFLLNYIPNIGSIIAAVPAVILTFLQLGFASATGVIALFITVNTVMGSVVEPRFMGRSLGLSTLVVFLSLIFWGWLLGLVGMLLSVPLTMIFKIALENTKEGRKYAILLSSDEEVEQMLAEELKAKQKQESVSE